MMTERPTKDSKLSKLRYTHIKMAPHVRRNIIYELKDMERFKYFMLSAIEAEKKSIKDFQAKESKGMPEDEKEFYYEMVSEDYFFVKDFFTEVSLYSFIMILYSYLESGLNSLCRVKYSDIVGQHKKNNLKAADEGRKQKKLNLKKLHEIRGSGIIHKAKKYLEEIMNINFVHLKNEWNEIDGLRIIRNAMVHSNGYFDDRIIEVCEKTKKLRIIDPVIERNSDDGRIEITNNGKIIIKQEYIDFILQQAVSFFKKLEV